MPYDYRSCKIKEVLYWIKNKGHITHLVDSYIDDKGNWLIKTKCSRLVLWKIRRGKIKGFSIGYEGDR